MAHFWQVEGIVGNVGNQSTWGEKKPNMYVKEVQTHSKIKLGN